MPMTGEADRQWIQYADGVMEPVRRGGDLNAKSRDPRSLDWWVVEKPAHVDPRSEGQTVVKNHSTQPNLTKGQIFTDEEKKALREEIGGRLGGFRAIASWPDPLTSCFSSCHDRRKKLDELEERKKAAIGWEQQAYEKRLKDFDGHTSFFLKNLW